MRKNILYAFLFVFLSFTLISCGMGNTVDETASNTTPDASVKELLSISAVSTGGKSYKFTPNISGVSVSELTYKWTFGDGGISEEQAPTYEFRNLGMNTVTLTTYKGEDIWKTTSTAVNVTNSGSISGLDIIARPESDGINYTFTSRAAAADGSDLEFTWNFNDDANNEQTGSNLNNVTHSFTQYDRVYNVTLTVTNPKTKDTATTNVAIKTPTPTFSFDVNAGAIAGSKRFIPNLSIDIPEVTYTWYFDTSKIGTKDEDNYTKTSMGDNAEVEFYYGTTSGKVTARCVVTSPKLAKEIVKEVSNINVGINFQLIAGSYEATSQDQLTFKYSVKGAFQGEDANKINSVKYVFYFADDSSMEVSGLPVLDGQTPVQGQTQAEATHTYENYRQNYVVRVEAKDSEGSVLGTLSNGLTHSFVAPEYSIETTTNPSNPFNVTFDVVSSYTLKDVVYSWNVGESGVAVIQGESVTHTYRSNGTFPITLTVKSNAGSFINYTATSSVAISESIQNAVISCTPKSGDENWLKYTCTTTATSTAGALQYVWKVDNAQVGTNATLEYIFPKYNGRHKVDLQLKIANTTITLDAPSVWKDTPTAALEIEGDSNVLSGIASPYNLKFKVTRDSGESKYVELTDLRSTWKFNETVRTEYNNQKSINHAFVISEGEANTLTRKMYVEVGGSNLNGNINSTKNVTVTKPEAELADITNVTVTCRNDSDWNVVKKHCKANITLNSSSTGKVDDFDISIFDTENLNTAKVVKNNQEVALELKWPDLNVTGKSTSRTFTIKAKVYKPSNPNKAIEKTTNVSVANYINYVLFPMPDKATEGGTGTKIGVYSCGYNSFYSIGKGVIEKPNCTRSNAASGNVVKGTINLGALINDNYQAPVRFRMVWGVRINGQEKIIKEEYIEKGNNISDNMLTFDISTAFNGITYAGSVYNDNDGNSMFFLRITDAVSKPLTVWYSGKYFEQQNKYPNKLQILAPIQDTTGHSCKYRVDGTTIYGDQLYVKFRQPFFNNGSGNFQLMFGGAYTTNTNSYRTIYGFGYSNVNNSDQSVGIKMLFYRENDTTVKYITINNVYITVSLLNSLTGSGSKSSYDNVYKGVVCN